MIKKLETELETLEIKQTRDRTVEAPALGSPTMDRPILLPILARQKIKKNWTS